MFARPSSGRLLAIGSRLNSLLEADENLERVLARLRRAFDERTALPRIEDADGTSLILRGDAPSVCRALA